MIVIEESEWVFLDAIGYFRLSVLDSEQGTMWWWKQGVRMQNQTGDNANDTAIHPQMVLGQWFHNLHRGT